MGQTLVTLLILRGQQKLRCLPEITGHTVFQVLGRDKRGLHPHAKRHPDWRHDCGGVVGRSDRLAGTTVWLEGPGLPGPHQPAAAVSGEPRRGLPDFCYLLHILRPSPCDPRSLLENLSDSKEEDTQATATKNHSRWKQRSWWWNY